jgi:alkyl sulfatase BDS1-like metallo-beta-lactamase superfamily hydrolase
MELGKEAFENGDYKWAATLINHLVFAEPSNSEARLLQADILEQMGYMAESGPWRNFYLSGANELRNGVQGESVAFDAVSHDVVQNTSTELFLDYMAVSLDADRAEGKVYSINVILPDIGEKFTLYLENAVLNNFPDHEDPSAACTMTVNRTEFFSIGMKKLSIEDAIKDGIVKLEGDQSKLFDLFGMLVGLNKFFWFNIVMP